MHGAPCAIRLARYRGAMLVVEVTEHAIERYGERVRPSLATGQLESEVLHVVEQVGVICWQPLEWCLTSDDPTTIGWLNVGADICFPLQFHRGKRGVLVATTCLTRGLLTEHARAEMNRRARNRRRRRAARRRDSYVPGNRMREAA
jgi:hypothetical protein